MDDILKARHFAQYHHASQLYGEQPYVVHLDAVAALVKPYGETAQVVAYLHDVVEDTEVTVNDLAKQFGQQVADCVAVLTDEIGKNRAERKQKTYAKMARIEARLALALIVKAADRLANVRACIFDKNDRLLKLYTDEHVAFTKALYRPECCDVIWNELNALIGQGPLWVDCGGNSGDG